MKSLFLLSLVIASIAIPAIAARDPDPRRGLKRAFLSMAVFIAAYIAYLTLVHVRVFVPAPR